MLPSYRNQSNWFLYESNTDVQWVKGHASHPPPAYGGVKNFRKVLAGEGVSFILLGELYQILPNFAGSTDKQRQSSFIEILKLHIWITSGEKLGRNLTENTSGSCFWQVAIISTDRVIHNKTMCFIVNEEITDVRILSLTNLKINHENDAGLQ